MLDGVRKKAANATKTNSMFCPIQFLWSMVVFSWERSILTVHFDNAEYFFPPAKCPLRVKKLCEPESRPVRYEIIQDSDVTIVELFYITGSSYIWTMRSLHNYYTHCRMLLKSRLFLLSARNCVILIYARVEFCQNKKSLRKYKMRCYITSIW